MGKLFWVVNMYFNNLKKLRSEKELTQEEVAKKLNCSRTTYNNWEQNVVMIPIDIADQLSLFYKVSLSCILGIENNRRIEYKSKVKKMNYDKLLKNLESLKIKKKYSYNEIGAYLSCSASSCQRYYKGIVKIPMDRLILLADLYEIDIDKLCGKE